MKKFFFSFCVFFFFSSIAFGQVLEKELIMPYDHKIGDWDIKIPVQENPPSFKGEIEEVFIVLNNNKYFNAQILGQNIELIHPSGMELFAGRIYYFSSVIYTKDSVFVSKSIKYFLPENEIALNWNVSSEMILETSFEIQKNLLNLEVSQEKTSLILSAPQSFDENQKELTLIKKDKNSFFYENILLEEKKDYYISSLVFFKNQFEEIIFYQIVIKQIKLPEKLDDFEIFSNVVEFSLTVLLKDNVPKRGNVFNRDGRLVKTLFINPNERIWVDELEQGVYILQIEGYKSSKKFIKL